MEKRGLCREFPRENSCGCFAVVMLDNRDNQKQSGTTLFS
jgi:hypothetical protein